MSATGSRAPLSAVDAAWLRMDTATNPMVITTVFRFPEPLDHEALTAVVRDRLLCHPRFRRRVVDHGVALVGTHWEEDPHFDLRNHVHRVALPGGECEGALSTLVSDLMSSFLDRARPLWQVHHVEGVGGGAAIVLRLHHCIADGISLVKLMRTVTDEGYESPPPAVGLPEPSHHHDGVRELVKDSAAQALTLGRLLMLPADPPSPFRGPLGVQKRAAWSRPIPLGTVKAIARRLGGTLNDVILGACAGALRDLMGSHAPRPGDRELRALIPVNFRSAREDGSLGNHFGLVFITLPVAVEEREERVRVVKARMDDSKRSNEATVALAVLGAMGVASAELEHIGVEVFSSKATFLVTNVPGPGDPVHIAGGLCSDVVVFAPVSGRIGVGFSFLSYGGALRLGVLADAGLLADPGALVAAFERQVAALE